MVEGVHPDKDVSILGALLVRILIYQRPTISHGRVIVDRLLQITNLASSSRRPLEPSFLRRGPLLYDLPLLPDTSGTGHSRLLFRSVTHCTILVRAATFIILVVFTLHHDVYVHCGQCHRGPLAGDVVNLLQSLFTTNQIPNTGCQTSVLWMISKTEFLIVPQSEQLTTLLEQEGDGDVLLLDQNVSLYSFLGHLK